MGNLKVYPICGSSNHTKNFFVQDWLTSLDDFVYEYRWCDNCEIIYLKERIDITKLYQCEKYFSLPSRISLIIKSLMWRLEQKFLSRLLPKNAKVLEIGFGRGEYLSFLESCGYEVYGVDVSSYAVEFAKSKYGLKRVYCAQLKEINFQDKMFDLVVLRHTFEHLTEPVYEMKEICRILKPKGLILIELPHISTIEYNIFGKYWAGFDAPRHTILFSISGILKFLSSFGFTILKKEYSLYLIIGYYLYIILLKNKSYLSLL